MPNIRICAAIATRERPKMLREALTSILLMDAIPNVSVGVLVVENSMTSSLRGMVEDISKPVTHAKIELLHQPSLGIVHARNAALSHAINENYDYLAFIDDDEIVSRTWLCELFNTVKGRNLQLVGGPVRAFVKDPPNTLIRQIIWRGYLNRVDRVERTSALLQSKGRDDQITLATNNWMVEIEFCRRTGLMFDMRYNFSGGEDTSFFRSAKELGAKTGWASQALASEEIPVARMSVKYQFQRALDQSVVSFHRKYESHRRLKWLIVPLTISYKTFVGCLLLLAIPLTRGSSLLGAIRALGFAAGRFAGLMGIESRHYLTTTGH